MNKEEFLKNYYCKLETKQSDNNFIVKTKVFNLNNILVDSVTTNMNIHETNNWIRDSQTAISLISYDWKILTEQAIKIHLNVIAQRIPLERFDFLDSSEMENFEIFYRK